MQEHQTIPTNATVSKDSDKISISVIMAVYEIIFFFFFINFLEDMSPFCGATDTPILDFW